MKNWLNTALLTVLVIAATLLWVGMRNRPAPTPMVASAPQEMQVFPRLRMQAPTIAPTPAEAPSTKIPLTLIPVPVSARDSGSAESHYVAQPGDTISKLAVDFFGSDNKANEDAILSSNPSLGNNPDRILAGQSYLIPARFPNASDSTVAVSPSSQPPATQPAVSPQIHQLRYSARPGDTVSILAGALLGSDTNHNRDTIINANPALVQNPDRVVVGKTYQIPVQTGQTLAAAATADGEEATPAATEPDADQLVIAGSTRELRYTAKAGDNVSTLAAALLGSDTKENRDAIVNSNPSLKQDPDRVLAGQTYWIPAPAAAQP